MRITDRSPSGRLLQTIFFPAEPRPVMPTEISDEIVLIHPAAPPMVALKEGKFFASSTNGAAGVFEVQGPLVPTDRYWWIQAADVSHNDTTARFLGIGQRDTSANNAQIFTGTVTRAAGVEEAMIRPFLLANDTRLVGTSFAIGAGFVLTLRFFYLEFLHAEINPTA